LTVAESVGAAPSPCRACARNLDRRTFLSAAAMAAVLAALDGCSGLTAPGGDFSGAYGGPFTVTLADFSALGAVGGVGRVDGGIGAPTALYRSAATSFIALSMVCPHQGFAPIDITSSGFSCPAHGSQFSKAGAVLSGPAPSNLATYTTTYDATAGTVTVNRPS
jgi:cytochrome b6-f complex iron-sulfur subunit